MKHAFKKYTKKQLAQMRKDRAFAIAAEVVLYLNVEKKPITAEAMPDFPYFESPYRTPDYRLIVLAAVGDVAVCRMRDGREVEKESIYEELLTVADPNCFLDKMTDNEVRNTISLALHLLTNNWFAVESIASKILALPQALSVLIQFNPSQYKLSGV